MEAQTYLRSIWSGKKEHHKNAEWLKDVKKDLQQDEAQDKINIKKKHHDECNEKDAKLKNSWSWQCPRLLVKEFNSIVCQINGVFAGLSRL